MRKNARPARLPRGDLGRDHRRRATWWPRPGRSSARSSRRSFPTTPGLLQIHSSCLPQPAAAARRAPSSWSAPGRRACRSPTSSSGRAGRSTSRSARTTGRRAAIAGATSSGGSASSASGMPTTPPLGAEHVTIAVSGADGGHTVDFRDLAGQRHHAASAGPSPTTDGVMRFAPDLRDNIASGDANYLSLLDEADAYVARNGLDLPEEPEARVLGPDPDCVTDPLLELDLAARRRHLDHLGDRLRRRLRLAEGRRLRRERQAAAPARRVDRARRLLPGAAVAVAARVELHLGRLARRQVPGRPHPDPAGLPRLRPASSRPTRVTEWNRAR